MGLLDKVKNILFDEEEVEIPEIKREPKKKKEVEEDSIKELKIPEEDFSDREYKSESTFTFPIDFEDEEPVKIEEQIEEVRQPEPIKKEREIRDYTDFLNRRNEKKRFKPTPIISPVYGVLDQNYRKEDVIVKESNNSDITLDEVRKKAYGSLEEELEQNLTTTKEIKVVKTKKVKVDPVISEDNVVEEPIDKMKTIGELIEEDAKEIEIPEIESITKEDNEYNNDEAISDDTKDVEELLSSEEETKENVEIDDDEADLFSLIDSMYEEKGE